MVVLKMRARVLGASLLALVMSNEAYAQQAAAGPADQAKPAAAGSGAVGDIVVTAQRRSSTVREVPFSIAAVGGDQIRTQALTNPQQLVAQIPGIVLNASDKSLSVVAIRGNTSTFRSAGLDAPIAFFVDDVYYPYSNDLNQNFFDMSRVEVLRGPQGTLFGRNVVGGAIAAFTNSPEFGEDYLAQLTVGNAGSIRTEGMVNGEIVADKLAARVAFSTDRTDGQIKTPNIPGKYGESDGHAIRGKLRYQPTDTLNIVIGGDYSYTKGVGEATQYVLGGARVIPASFGNFVDAPWTNNGSLIGKGDNEQRLRGGYVRADLDLLGGSLTSITGYRLNNSHNYDNNVPINTFPVQDFDSVVKNRSFTQEVRFASAPNRLSFVVGAFYLHGNFHTINTLSYRPLAGSAFAAAVPPCPAGAVTCPGTAIRRDLTAKVDSYAVFGEATLKLTPQLMVIGGGRFSNDQKDINYIATSNSGLAVPGLSFSTPGVPTGPFVSTGIATKSWSRFTPRATLKWVPNDAINFYATYSKGYKSGGFVDNAYRNPTLPLEPEDSTNFEIGTKSRLFDNRLDLNISLFRQKTVNLQNFSGAGGIPHTYNGTSLTKGAEVESVIRLTPDFRLRVNYTFLDGKYLDLRDPVTNLQFAGNPLKYTPRNSFFVQGDYTANLSGGAKLNFEADYAYSDRVSTSDDNSLPNSPTVYDATRGSTVNAQVRFQTANERFELALWSKNLFNHFQIAYADDTTAFITTSTSTTRFWRAVTNLPRTFGITATFRH